MKRIFTGVALALLCAGSPRPVAAQDTSAFTAGRMDDLTAGQKAAATALRLTGSLSTAGNSDFRQMRDLCWQLRSADLSGADCREIPKNAFHSRHRLESVVFPPNVLSVGTQAFYACTALRKVELPASVERVGDGAFLGCTALEEVTLNGAPVLGDFAFARLAGLKCLTVNSRVPPKASASTFEGIDRKGCKLVVPRGAEWAYRHAEGWRRFFSDDTRSGYEVCRPADCLIPVPSSLSVDTGAEPLEIRHAWEVSAADGLANECERAEEMLRTRLGDCLSAKKGKKADAAVRLTLALDASLPDPEAYTLCVTDGGVTVKGGAPAGVFYGLMTLDQLLRGSDGESCCDALPQLTVTDKPRTHVRELMVDPARIFVPLDELKAFVPEMARYKYNAIHLHLVDDQAWRIEIKKYPRLTVLSSSRTGMDDMQMPISGFYTQEEMRDFVSYCAKYHVMVVPEIEMPGHEVAAVHAYPELTCGAKKVPIRTTCGVSNELLCPGSEFTYEFLGNVFRELADVFPCKYVHLGGDEAGQPALGCWTDCEKDKELKKRLGVTTTDRSENWRLQEYMFNRVIDTLQTKYGKTPMFWYETDFKNIQPGCVTFAWRHGLTKTALDAAVANNAKIMLCPGEHCYLDYPMAGGDMPEVNWGMPVTSLRQTYSLDPAWGMDGSFEKNNLFGVAGTLWSESINSPERISYQAYPRALALAEAGWSEAKNRSWESFVTRLRPVLRDMQRRGVTYSMEF